MVQHLIQEAHTLLELPYQRNGGRLFGEQHVLQDVLAANNAPAQSPFIGDLHVKDVVASPFKQYLLDPTTGLRSHSIFEVWLHGGERTFIHAISTSEADTEKT